MPSLSDKGKVNHSVRAVDATLLEVSEAQKSPLALPPKCFDSNGNATLNFPYKWERKFVVFKIFPLIVILLEVFICTLLLVSQCLKKVFQFLIFFLILNNYCLYGIVFAFIYESQRF